MSKNTGPTVSKWGYVCGAAFLIVVVWVWFALENYAGYKINGRKIEPGGVRLPLAVPVTATPLAVVILGFLYYREAGFLCRAQRVRGRIESVGGIEAKNLRDVAYSYEVDGKPYRSKRSVVATLAETFAVGSEVEVMFDPKNPSRSRLSFEYASSQQSTKESGEHTA